MAAKKSKSYKPEYYDEEERKWKEWGHGFGRKMGAWGRGFGEEMGRQFGKAKGKWHDSKSAGASGDGNHNAGSRGDDSRNEGGADFEGRESPNFWGRRHWWFWPFGMIGPLLSSIFGIIVLIIGLWILSFFNVVLRSAFISLLVSSVSANIQWFLAFSLFMGYCNYFMRFSGHTFWVLYPVSRAAGLTFAAWILSWLLRVLGAYSNAAFLMSGGTLLRENLIWVFAIAAVLSYFAMLVRHSMGLGRKGHW